MIPIAIEIFMRITLETKRRHTDCCREVLPIQDMLRTAWNSNNYMTSTSASTGSDRKTRKPFLVEESARPTIQNINELMGSDFAWSCISLISTLASESDRLGVWSECCPCPEHQFQGSYVPKQPRRKRRKQAPPGASTCSLRCCRAPELAAGIAMRSQAARLDARAREFLQSISQIPVNKRSELSGAFGKSLGRLWGISDIMWILMAFCFLVLLVQV